MRRKGYGFQGQGQIVIKKGDPEYAISLNTHVSGNCKNWLGTDRQPSTRLINLAWLTLEVETTGRSGVPGPS